ncbi:MAG: sigma-54-dependent Fis family transcriptional regulator [Ignavibacteria bacterium]|jgi:transcriptional regulator with GAF, ATPase, and Fis domain|nr:sigma-54-dependent Fis family transcriptional regulator [Ignavibacteria bacterium]MCU7502920.1 sigma-54-dependent Fis family transcriptional regulator [Ignavibacteria bacterium]MCU7515586.1 sigma-54-dependent Fis family transcriptional regulator [Ignavibacteria bacterium]
MLNRDLSVIISINETIASIKEPYKLFEKIFDQMQDLLQFQIGGMALLDKTGTGLEFFAAASDGMGKPLSQVLWYNRVSISGTVFSQMVANPKISIADLEILRSFKKSSDQEPLLEESIKNAGIKNILQIPMQTGGELMGFLFIPYNDCELNADDNNYLLKISNVIATAVSNVRAFEEMKQHKEVNEIQLRLMNALVSLKDRNTLVEKCAEELTELIPCEYISFWAGNLEVASRRLAFSLIMNEENRLVPLAIPGNAVQAAVMLRSKEINGNYLEIAGEEFNSLCAQSKYFLQLKEKHSITSLLMIRYAAENVGELILILGRGKNMYFVQKRNRKLGIPPNTSNISFMDNEIEAAMHILPQLGLVLSNFFAFEQINLLKNKLEQEKNYLLDEINLSNSFQEIIGNSPAIQSVMNKIKQVAPINATVLIQGETGTGKELVARAIHNLSERKDSAFVKINCAALPVSLIESELFGHEKGSFTGAIEKRIGKFELADGGTIFLDEIGELPLEIQSRLLRILQEKEFERIGGKGTIKVDVRIIAATNRELAVEVDKGRFRADLFFRLNVFPITVPPLRERTEDIPLLLKFFIEKYSKQAGREKKIVRKSDLDMLLQYNWPGNIRELEHLIERSVIISEGAVLNFNDVIHLNMKNDAEAEKLKTLREMEKEHIIHALQIAKGKVTGENSASSILGINGKTLGSKMKKLGIAREIVIRTQLN